jgi:hypothetical protein
VITEFALSAAHILQAAQIVKNDRENPPPVTPPTGQLMAAWRRARLIV